MVDGWAACRPLRFTCIHGLWEFQRRCNTSASPEKIYVQLGKELEGVSAQSKAEIQRDVKAAKSVVTRIGETADEAEHKS